MIKGIKTFNENQFLRDFKRRFTNLLEKAPIKAFATYYRDKVSLDVEGSDIYEYPFNFSEDVKKNIYKIKQHLVKEVYPIIIVAKKFYEDYSAEDRERFIKTGMSLEEALSVKKQIIKNEEFKITKVVIKRDELFLENIKTGKNFRYKLNMPISIFMKRLREGIYTPEKAGEIFLDKSVLITEIYSEKEWNDIQGRKNITII